MKPTDSLQQSAQQNSLIHDILQNGTVYRMWISIGIKSDAGRLELYTDGILAGKVALIVPLAGSVVLSDELSVQAGAIIRHLCKA